MQKNTLAISFLIIVFIFPYTSEATFLGKPGMSQREAIVHKAEAALPVWSGIKDRWRGACKQLKNRGLQFDFFYTGEFTRNLDAGLVNAQTRTIYQDNLGLTVTLDTGKAGLWPGGTFFLYAIRNHGGNPSSAVIGDLQGASNIEAPDQFLVYEAWFEQQLASGRLSLLFGLYDLNSEFYVSEYGSLFLNSSFGIGPELATSVSASIFPRPGLGARLRVNPLSRWYVQAALLDGDPQTRSLSTTEGKMLAVESGVILAHGDYKAGYWRHSADKHFNGRLFGHDYGLYAVADQLIFTLSDGGSIAAFAQAGWAPAARNQVWRYLGGGLHIRGILPRRQQDDVGMAIASASTHQATETVLEVTYRATVTSWLAIQPSVQWIRHPGGERAAGSIRVALLRFEISCP